MLDSNHKETEYDRVNVGEEDELQLQGFTSCLWRTILFVILVIISGGLILFYVWIKPASKVRLMKKRCALDRAQILVIKDKYGDEFVEPLQQIMQFSHRYFVHKKLKYVWNEEYKHFVKLKGLDQERCSVIYSQMEGCSSSEAELKLNIFGRNSIEIEVLPIWKMALNEITTPFYLYQFFIIIVWLIQIYYQFAACIFILSTISVSTHVWQTRKQSIALRKKVYSNSLVTVLRDSVPVTKNSTELVPGDVIILPKHHSSSYHMECDAVLMTGSCIMDESMLTGESVPVPKVPLVDNPSATYSSSIHKSNTLFSGTRLLNVYIKDNRDVTAVVIRTGFSTTKGELARSILFPMQMNNNIKRQMMKMFLIFAIFIGIPAATYTYYALTRFNFRMFDVWIVVLDVGTFLIPPVLPAVLTSVNVHGQRRLKKKGIFCLNPQAICCSGEIDVMCFDKTGTLTEDTIDFAGILPVSDDGNFDSMTTDVKSLPKESIIVKSMATCHSLVEYQGNLEGDDLDMKLFNECKWDFVKDFDDCEKTFGKTPERIVANTSEGIMIGIMKQFPFESFLQRMMVIIKDSKTKKFQCIVKGAPEVLKLFCLPQTLPEDFNQILESYTGKGFRVLAVASKVLSTENVEECMEMDRNELENQMTFHGFFLFKNKLKPNTHEILQELTDANIRCVMATGDNILTAINVAQECEMVKKSDAIIRVQIVTEKPTNQSFVYYNYVKFPDFMMVNNNSDLEASNFHRNENFNYHLAIDGETYMTIKNLQPDLIEKIVHKGTIFARMTPDQKLSLIQTLRNQNHSVGMCGDGANDCGALRAADAGISLSVAEASVASPFTYKNKDISCVPSLIKEGRCTLVSVFGTFKYQVIYCFTLLGAVLISFWHGIRPSDGTYVFVDVIMNIFPPMVFATTEPYPKLSKRMPIRNMLSFVTQLSIYSFIIIQVLIYYLIRTLLIHQPWYQEAVITELNAATPNQVCYAIFSSNTMSYVIAAIVFAPGPPFRKGFFSNKIYMFMVAVNFCLSFTMSIISPQFLMDFFQYLPMPFEFRLKIAMISLINLIISLILEKYIFYGLILNHLLPWIKTIFKHRSKKKFRIIEYQIRDENWPFNNLKMNEFDNLANNLNEQNGKKSF